MLQHMKARRLLPLFCLSAAMLVITGCARTPDQKYAKFMERGAARLNRHEYARAVLEFRSAIQIKPRVAEGYYEMALAYLGLHDIRTAVHYLYRTLEVNPKYIAAELKLSDLAVATHNPAELQEAEKHLRRVLQNSPANVDALDILAKAEWGLAKREEAEKLLKQAFERSPQSLRSSADLAQLELWNNDRVAAEATLKRTAENNPGSPAIAVTLGRFYVVIGRPKEAEQQFERALQLDPENTGALLSLAGIRWNAGRLQAAEQLYRRLSNSPDPELKPIHAIFLFQSGKRAAAISELEKLYRQNPTNRSTRTRLIMAYQMTGRSSDAEKLLIAVLRKNPKDVDALLERSAVYLRVGQANQAQADLNTVLRFRPDFAAAHYLLSKVHEIRRESQMEKQELTEALRLDSSLLVARIQLAKWLISHNAAREARDVLNEAPPSQRNNLEIRLHLNWAALALGDRIAARNGIDRALATSRDPEMLVQDATLKMLQQDYEGGRQSAQEALEKNPDYPEALSLIVQSYEIQNKLPELIQWLRAYAERRPKSAPVQFQLGQVLMSIDRAGARAAFNAAKAAKPDSTAADLYLARLDIGDRKLDDAQKRLSTVVSKDRNNLLAHLMLGNVEQIARNYGKAAEQYRTAVQLDDRNPEALNDLAYALAESGKQTDEALKFAQKAEELAPANPSIAETLGWVLYRKGLYASAIPYLEQAVSLGSTALRKCHLALAYLKSGDRVRGQQMLAAALKMDPGLSRSELVREAVVSLTATR